MYYRMMISTRSRVQPSSDTNQILVRFQNANLDEGLCKYIPGRGEYGGTYKSSDPRSSPECFIKHLPSHLVHVRRNLWWTKVGIVVPDDVIQLFDTEIVHRIKHYDPHYVVSCVTCA